MTIEERLEMLEKELTRANRRNRRLLAGVALCLGLAVAAWILRPQALLVKSTADLVKEVRANRFVLEDEKGKGHIVLESTPLMSGLQVYGENGGVLLGLLAGWPIVNLCDEKGRDRASLIVNADGPVLCLYDEEGTLRARLGTGKNISPDGNIATAPESSLLLQGPDGKVRWQSP